MFRSWWQKAKKPLEIFAIIVVCVLAIVLLVVIALAYIFNVNVPGLRGKTIWDWLQLLIVPVALAVVAFLFNRSTSSAEQANTQKRYENDQKIADGKQKDELLQTYLDRMSELLLNHNLRRSESSTEVRYIAQARTLTIFPQLDAKHKSSIILFLRNAGLIDKGDDNIIDLSGADLSGIDLSGVSLDLIRLSNTNMSGADLSGAYLMQADLRGANLSGANLYRSSLLGADLSTGTRREKVSESSVAHEIPGETDLSGANLQRAFLIGANLHGAKLIGAKLHETVLVDAQIVAARLNDVDLSGASLEAADLSGSDLYGANLTEAKLKGAKITQKQLNQVMSLQGATMPDGSKHP
jgi:uncharacterized protein YjbI with pentapeptide repeats